MSNTTSNTSTPLLSDKTYDFIRYFIQYVLPGAGTLYFTLASIWGLPNAEQVVGTLAATTVFLSLLLGYSKKSYVASEAKYDGALVVDTSNPDKDIYSLEVTTPLDEVNNSNHILLKIDNAQHLKSQ